jgi:hypothetical protein
MKKATGYVATASLVACPFVSSVTVAMPTLGSYITTATTNIEPVKLTKTPVLARNTTASSDITPATANGKEQKQHDKKAMGRCWKRLMTMVREVAYAHHKNRK